MTRPAGGTADSAGVPWEGRSFRPNPAAGDDGSADAALADALATRLERLGVGPRAVPHDDVVALAVQRPGHARTHRAGSEQCYSHSCLPRSVRPTRDELYQYTLVVVIFIVVIMLYVIGLDQIYSRLVDWIFGSS